MSHSFKKVWNVVSTVLVVLVVLLAVALVGVRLVGLNTYVVLSGSMEPTYHTGSLLYVKSVDPQDLQVGDPITFMLNEDTVATHRIIEILPDEEDSSVLRFRTQGDANDAPDGTPVHYKNVIGKPVFSVPYLGYFANFVQNPPGLYFAIGFAVVLVLLFKLRPAWLLTGFNSVLGALALFQPFTDFVGGMFSVTGIVYYLSVAGLFLFLTGQALERRRWN